MGSKRRDGLRTIDPSTLDQVSGGACVANPEVRVNRFGQRFVVNAARDQNGRLCAGRANRDRAYMRQDYEGRVVPAHPRIQRGHPDR